MTRCAAGLAFFGTGIACFVDGGLGLAPWDMLHQGISEHTGIELGTIIILLGFSLLVLWIPLRQRPGIGTVMNAFEIGLVENIAQDLLPDTRVLAIRISYVIIGIVLVSIGSGLYIGAELGTGPRDGLMVGLHRRFGISVRLARTLVEITVMVVGLFLGGQIGVGTFMFAFGIGPMVNVTLRWFRMQETSSSGSAQP
ncbi:MAG: hypothetical protein EXQ63_03805 [Ilumatobacteraceae bacterium]|nr:hypothetical protein [Ilumatobacteraceae bacterium]